MRVIRETSGKVKSLEENGEISRKTKDTTTYFDRKYVTLRYDEKKKYFKEK